MPARSTLRPYIAGLIIAGAFALVVALLVNRGRHETLVVIEPAPQGQTVTVFVGGAVERPGVYTLNRGDRVEAAIAAAGGFTAEADPDGVNRALRLRDEGQVIVPRKGEPRSTAAPAAPDDGTTPPATAAASGAATSPPAPLTRINVNTAPAAELEKLPGVGPRLAQEIVDYRVANGPFATPADLAKVKGISERMVAGWADLITVGP